MLKLCSQKAAASQMMHEVLMDPNNSEKWRFLTNGRARGGIVHTLQDAVNESNEEALVATLRQTAEYATNLADQLDTQVPEDAGLVPVPTETEIPEGLTNWTY